MNIDPSKTYQYSSADISTRPEVIQRKPSSCTTDWPILSINTQGAAFHHKEDGTCADPRYSLIESPRVAREWDMVIGNNGRLYWPEHCFPGAAVMRVREILPEPVTPDNTSARHVAKTEELQHDFPAVGTRLRFTKHPFHGVEVEATGNEVVVTEISKDHFETTDNFEGSGWQFERNWREGLEVVPAVSKDETIPEISPEEQAAKDALEPVKVQRWSVNGLDGSRYPSETGEYVRYSDIAHLLERGGE